MNIVNPGNAEINAYGFIDAETATPSITKAKGITSLVDGGVGKTQLNFSPTLPSINYSAATMVGPFDSTAAISALEYDPLNARSATDMVVWTAYDVGTLFDCYFSVIITGA